MFIILSKVLSFNRFLKKLYHRLSSWKADSGVEVSVQEMYQEVLTAFTPVMGGKEIGLGRRRSKAVKTKALAKPPFVDILLDSVG